MNILGPTLLLYLLIGGGIAAALYLCDSPRPAGERFLRLATALPFWPLYLPILLARPASFSAPEDDLARTLAVVERELDAAQTTLDEWIGISEEQRQHLQKLRQAWSGQSERLREMDRLLARPEYALGEEASPSSSVTPRIRQSLTARQQNLQRLRQVRQQVEADLLASLAWVRELASRIHLARFTDAPPARAEELLAALANAVETLSAPHGSPEQRYAIKKAE